MRLYAKITSERASKGQGGNDYLKIVISNEKKENKALLDITNDQDGFVIDYTDYATGQIMRLKEEISYPKGLNKHGRNMVNNFRLIEESQKAINGKCKHDNTAVCIKCANYPLI